MQWAQQALKRRASAVTALVAGVMVVGLPIEITIRLSDQPLLVPRLAWLLLFGSCLLLVGSGLELRRLEAARLAARPPAPDA